jgi:heme exporter protein D
MVWASWQDFFAMGGYALYVWGSVVVCCAFLVGEIWQVRSRWKATRAAILKRTGHEGKT